MSKKKTPKLPQSLTDGEKKEILREHFYYEVQMLDFSVDKVVEYNLRGKTDKCLKNMAVDTCLLHARNLWDFFFFRPSKNYVRASHFLDSWGKPQIAGNSWIKKVEKRVNDEITHLTVGRISSSFSNMQWNCCAIRKEFFDVIITFLGQLPQKYMDEKLRKLKRRILSVLDSYMPEDNSGVTQTSSDSDIYNIYIVNP